MLERVVHEAFGKVSLLAQVLKFMSRKFCYRLDISPSKYLLVESSLKWSKAAPQGTRGGVTERNHKLPNVLTSWQNEVEILSLGGGQLCG